jgi:hypothetical protein
MYPINNDSPFNLEVTPEFISELFHTPETGNGLDLPLTPPGGYADISLEVFRIRSIDSYINMFHWIESGKLELPRENGSDNQDKAPFYAFQWGA